MGLDPHDVRSNQLWFGAGAFVGSTCAVNSFSRRFVALLIIPALLLAAPTPAMANGEIAPPAPDVTSVNPSTGVVEGDAVTITGTDLDTATVTVGGESVTITTNTSTEIIFTAPNLARTKSLVVTTAGGSYDTVITFAVVCPETFSGGSGDSSDPFLISNASDLAALHSDDLCWETNLLQTADIDMGGATWNHGIGSDDSDSAEFVGSYDGGGYTISNLSISTTDDYAGLFGEVYTNGEIRNVGFTGNVSATRTSSFSCDAGGLVGRLYQASVHNSFATGNVSTTESSCDAGGLIGELVSSTVTTSYATGSVTTNGAGTYVGGLIGKISNSPTRVSDSYANGDATSQYTGGATRAGGLIGLLAKTSDIRTSYATGDASVPSGDAGGLIATADGYTGDPLTDSFASGTPDNSDPSNTEGTFVTTTELATLATFTDAGWSIAAGWSASTPPLWGICSGYNNGYPFLNGTLAADPCPAPAPDPGPAPAPAPQPTPQPASEENNDDDATPAAPTQTPVTPVSFTDPADVTAAQVEAFSPAQVATIPARQVTELPATAIAAISPDQAAALSRAQLNALRGRQTSSLTPQTVAALPAEAITGLRPAAAKRLTPAAVAAMQPDQVAALRPVAIARMTPAQFRAMDAEQLAAMTPAQTARIKTKRLRALKPKTLADMTPEAFARIPARRLANLRPRQVRALTPEQLDALTPEQRRAL